MLQANLLESPGAFQHFFDHHPDAMLIVDLGGRILEANREAFNMLGYSMEELLQTSLFQLENGASANCHRFEPGFREPFEWAVLHKEGQVMRVRVTCSPLVSDGQEFAKLVMLEASFLQGGQLDGPLRVEEMFAFISEKSQNIISVISADGVFTYISPTVTALLGYEPQEVIGKPATVFNHPETNEELLEFRKSLSVDQDSERFTGRIRHKNGEYRWYETTVQYIRDPSGAIVQTIGVGRDITDRKEAEKRIAYLAYHDTLTDLPNRRLFKQYVSHVLERATGEVHSLTVLDVDEFKYVNDTFGHDAGDLLLMEVANRLTSVVGNSGLVARWGGDEFTVFRERIATEDEWDSFLRRVQVVLSEPMFIAGHTLRMNVSIGVAMFPRDGQAVETLMRHADKAMYSDKQRKNRL